MRRVQVGFPSRRTTSLSVSDTASPASSGHALGLKEVPHSAGKSDPSSGRDRIQRNEGSDLLCVVFQGPRQASCMRVCAARSQCTCQPDSVCYRHARCCSPKGRCGLCTGRGGCECETFMKSQQGRSLVSPNEASWGQFSCHISL